MKHLFVISIAFFLLLGDIFAQNKNMEAARLEFRKGNYQDAVGLYNGAIATASNQKEKEDLTKEREKASKCWQLRDEADRFFSIKSYDYAIKIYTQLHSLNAYDNYAKNQINKCRDAKLKIAYAHRDNDYKKALQRGDIESIKAFLKSYPNDKEKNMLTFIISDRQHIEDSLMTLAKSRYSAKKDIEKDFEGMIVQNYVATGDAFYKVGNLTTARKYYAVASSYGDAEAIYKKAKCDGESSASFKNLIAIAAAGGYTPAEKDLQQLIQQSPDYVFNKNVAKRMYGNVHTYKTSASAALHIYLNKEVYCIEDLDVEQYILNNNGALRELQYKYLNDNILYQAGLVWEECNKDPTLIMQASAAKGNIAAIKWLADKGDAEYKICYEYSQNKENNCASYIGYLKGDSMTPADWYNIYSSRNQLPIDRHEALIALANSNAFTDKVYFKELKELLSHYRSWDNHILSELRSTLKAQKTSRATKTLKKISKLNGVTHIYDIQKSPMYNLAKKGCYDEQHDYVQSVKKEYIWRKTSSSAEHGYNSNSNPNNDTPTVSKNIYSTSSKSAITEDPIKALLDEAYNYYNGEGGVSRDRKKALSLARQAHKLLDEQKNPYTQTRSFTYKKGTVNIAYTGFRKVCIYGRWGVIVQSYSKDAETMVIPCLFKEQEVGAHLYNGRTYNERLQSGSFTVAADKGKLKARVQTYKGGGTIVKACY